MRAIWLTIRNIPNLYFSFRNEIKESKKYNNAIKTYGILDTMLREFEQIEEDMPDQLCQIALEHLVMQYKEMGEERDKVHESALKKYCEQYAVDF